jgi:lipopolysaccharide export system protein LptA
VNWRVGVRIGVGVVGLGCAVALVVLRRDRPDPTPPPVLDATDPASQSQHQRGSIIVPDAKTGALRATITYERFREYEDGRGRYETVVMTVVGEDPFELRAGSLETRTKGKRGEMPDEWELADGIQLKTPSGFHLESDRRESTGTLTLPGVVTFGRDRMSGSGTGAVHRRDAGTLQLLEDARLVVAPDAAGVGGLSATASTMVLNRVEHVLHLDGAAALQLDAQTLQAAKISAFLTEDEQTVTSLRLLGKAEVTPAVGAANPVPAMKGEAIDLTMRPDGRTVQRAVLARAAQVGLGRDGLRAPWIDIELAPNGATVTRLDAREGVRADIAAAPEVGARTIDARTLAARGSADAGLTTARFEGDVVFKEQRDDRPPIEGSARTLTLALKGGLGAIDSAEFLESVRFSDAEVIAEAPRAVYDAAKDRLMLYAGARPRDARPAVKDARVRLWADHVDIQMMTHDMRATGKVETRTVPDAASKTRENAAAGLFDRTKEVRGEAPEVQYGSASGRVTYTGAAAGRARVWQEANAVTADEVTVDDATENLTARGRVETDLELDTTGGDGKPARWRIQSETADVNQSSGRAVFKGRRVVFAGKDLEATGSMLEVQLAAGTRALDGFTISGDVEARLPGGREALGDRIVFDAARRTYQLIGTTNPALAKTPGEPGADCAVAIGARFELDEATNAFRSAGGSVASSITVPCNTPLRSIRKGS